MKSTNNFDPDINQVERVHIFVAGRVQGVGFRYFTLDIANRYNITGWVRNTHHQEVEIIAEGYRSNLEIFINLIRQGPSSAFVQDLNIEWLKPTKEFNRFSVLPTN
ncbi:MAG: acylphosphatase [Anaerolineaceae bacterium]|jgi:acylphosphatase|nr:MAG: acylphosphatase [Chloroflexi bacterium HGW-Chloroflexi-8]